MKISEAHHKLRCQTISALDTERSAFLKLWQELADFYLPKRYVWLQNKDARAKTAKNPNILDGTGTKAARTLAAGMMNGITSPSRPWFSLTIPGVAGPGAAWGSNASYFVQAWCDEVTRRMLSVMAESNFYNAMAVQYLDLVVFGSSAMLIYEDQESVIRCYNPALGEYYFGQDSRLQVNTFARTISKKVSQIVSEFGLDNCSDRVKTAWRAGGARLLEDIDVQHLVEPNTDGQSTVSKRFPFRETYWEKSESSGRVLRQRGFFEMPGVFPRWELTANDSYGTSPCMDALPDVKQLQHETKRKAQGLDITNRPPMIADVQLEHKPSAFLPGGITFVAGANSIGAKPAYQISLPLGEMTMDIQDVRQRIRETLHNDLFMMISQLDTVRSATEIDARREEKLVLLGSVLERFENEALDPAINRIFSIMDRMGLIPEPPEEIADMQLQVQYVSILTTAQRATGAIPTERYLTLLGNLAAVRPDVLDLPNFDSMLRNYGESIGVSPRDLNSPEQVKADRAARNEQLQAQQAAVVGNELATGAKTLSETEVGGGANALQRLLGG